MTPESTLLDDLDWLAFRYVAGELTTEETAAFEERLSDDQAAREAVAHAVALIEAIGPRPGLSPFRVRRLVVAALAAAACVLLAVSVGRFGASQVQPNPSAVALTWSGLRQDAELDRHELLSWLDEPNADGEDDAETTDQPPTWLIDATSLPETSPAVSPGF